MNRMNNFKMNKLLNENIYPSCEYCRYGNKFIKQKTILCIKFGVVDSFYSCKKFKYDPLKRIPKARKELNSFDENDFLI